MLRVGQDELSEHTLLTELVAPIFHFRQLKKVAAFGDTLHFLAISNECHTRQLCQKLADVYLHRLPNLKVRRPDSTPNRR